jgi:AcrR family transcriptional regulator
MQEWIPIPGTAKARLVEAAVHQFETAGYDAVNVTELAAKAGVTTGSLYHHFGSKLGLYAFVRDDVERRVTDRLEGALAVTIHDDVGAALVVAFDYALRAGFARMLSEPHPEARPDPVAAVLGEPPVGAMLAAAWRAGLGAAADGVDPERVRDALRGLIRPALAVPVRT